MFGHHYRAQSIAGSERGEHLFFLMRDVSLRYETGAPAVLVPVDVVARAIANSLQGLEGKWLAHCTLTPLQF